MEFSDLLVGEYGEGAGENNGKLSQWGTLLRLLKMMKAGFWRYLAAIVTMSVALSAFDTVTALLLKDIIARARGAIAGQDAFEGLWQNVAGCLGIGLVCILLYVVGFYVYTMEAKKGAAYVQKATYSKSLRMPYEYYVKTHSGEFISKVVYDSDRATGIYGSRFRRILMPFLMTVFFLLPMFALSWQVTLCLFLCSATLLLINGTFVSPMRKVSKQMSSTNESLTQRISDILAGMEQIKIFGLQAKKTEQFITENRKYKRQQRKMNIMSACLDGLNQCFELLGSLLFIALGVFFVAQGITTVDNLAAIYVLYGTMSWNLLQVGVYIPSMASYLANAKRVFEFLDLPEEPETGVSVPVSGMEVLDDTMVCFSNVTFAYDEDTPVFKDFNLEVKRGRCVALKGESGKGKSTIAKLLLGFHQVDSGAIYLKGKRYDQYKLEQIRDMISYVPQEPYLYNVSIAENIRYGKPGATMEEIKEAARLANAHEFIEGLEQGYDTIAGERGNHLSGGQRQRIAIARAILKNAEVLILDEATSALDNESEHLVNDALKRLMAGKTTIVIAHRISTLEQADEVIEI